MDAITLWEVVPDALTGNSRLHELFYVLVHMRPPHMNVCEKLHFYNAWLALVQFIQDCRLVLSRNNHTHPHRRHPASTVNSCV